MVGVCSKEMSQMMKNDQMNLYLIPLINVQFKSLIITFCERNQIGFNIICIHISALLESSSLSSSSSPSSPSLESGTTSTSDSSTDTSSPSMSAKLLCSIRARNPLKPSYFHSFGMTDNYIVFSEQTLHINVAKLASSQIMGKPVSSCFEFDHNGTTLFHLVEKQTGRQMTTRYETGPLFGMHVINSYEEDGHVVFDICSYDDDELLKKFYLDYLRHGDQDGKRHFPITEVRRFVLPLRINKVNFNFFIRQAVSWFLS